MPHPFNEKQDNELDFTVGISVSTANVGISDFDIFRALSNTSAPSSERS
jgi:hypothetical protein